MNLKMNTRLLIMTIIAGIFVVVMIVNTFGETCILVEEGAANDWLGSIDGCGPLLTYTIHQYFGIFW